MNFDAAFNHPEDIVAISRQFSDMNFVVYHAAWDPSHTEGPYDATATTGIDSLLASLDRHNVPPNDNVWVDLATVWRQLLTQPDQAAHATGKLLSRVGQHRVDNLHLADCIHDHAHQDFRNRKRVHDPGG